MDYKALELIVVDDYEAMSQLAAERIFMAIKKKPDLLLSIATGSTPTRAYELLVEKSKADAEAFKQMRMVKLDEWGGVPLNDPSTCETYIQRHLISPLNISPDRFISWESNPQDPAKEVTRITRLLEKAGDIDENILGLGLNGHLGFNEPASALQLKPHVTRLSASTLKHAMAQVAEHEITYGLTLGIGEIMRSKKVLFLVSGAQKIQPLKDFLSQEITAQIPASMLWLHPNVTVICDKAALPEMPKHRE